MRGGRKIILRADGNSIIGLGHVARCCALADMLKNEFELQFYIRKTSEAIIENIRKYCTSVAEIDATISYEQEAGHWISSLDRNEIVVLDGYCFNTNYQQMIKKKGCKLVCIDDVHAYHYAADVVINHAPGIVKDDFSCEPYTQLYLGLEYVLLKKLFLKKAAENKKHFNLDASPVLICLGGADPENVTLEVLEQIKKLLPAKKLIVIAGVAYRFTEVLKERCKTDEQLLLYVNVEPELIAELMNKANIAVTSASTIALEYLCVKGNLFIIQTADNQKHIYNALIERGFASSFEDFSQKYNSYELADNSKFAIDGKSDERVLEVFTKLFQKL